MKACSTPKDEPSQAKIGLWGMLLDWLLFGAITGLAEAKAAEKKEKHKKAEEPEES